MTIALGPMPEGSPAEGERVTMEVFAFGADEKVTAVKVNVRFLTLSTASSQNYKQTQKHTHNNTRTINESNNITERRTDS